MSGAASHRNRTRLHVSFSWPSHECTNSCDGGHHLFLNLDAVRLCCARLAVLDDYFHLGNSGTAKQQRPAGYG